MEDLLKSYAKKRQDEAGGPLELHPATRRLLQGEIARTRPKPASGGRSWLSALLFSPRLVGAAALVLVLGVGYWSFVEQQSPRSGVDGMTRLPEIAESILTPAPAKDALFAETLDRAAPPPPTAQDALTVLSRDTRAGESGVLLEQKSKDATKVRSQEKIGRTEVESVKREALSELEIAGVRQAEDKPSQPTAPKPTDSEVSQLGKQSANQPAPARELDADFTLSRAARSLKVADPQPPATPQPTLAPARLGLASDAPVGGGAKAKEAEFYSKAAGPDPAGGLVVPPSLQLDSAQSLAFLFDSSGVDRFGGTTGPVTNLSFSLVAPARSFAVDGLSSWSLLENNASGFLTNSAFGLSHLNGQQAGAFSNPTPAPTPALQSTRPATSSGIPIESGLAQVSTPSQPYQRLNTLADTKADQGRRQLFRQLTKAPAPAGGRNSQAEGGVLASFEFQQLGDRARVIDADGSIYEGPLVASSPDSTAAASQPAAPTQAIPGRAVRIPPTERQRLSGTVQGLTQPNIPRFRLTGTNRTLRQIVVFEGGFVTAEPGGVGGDEVALVKKLAERRATPQVPAGPAVTGSAQQIRGTLRIGAGNASPVEAVPVDN